MQINGEDEMGTFMLYLIVICLLVMVYVLFEIRSQVSRLRVSLERHLDGSRAVLIMVSVFVYLNR